jgi:hypothetical protein
VSTPQSPEKGNGSNLVVFSGSSEDRTLYRVQKPRILTALAYWDRPLSPEPAGSSIMYDDRGDHAVDLRCPSSSSQRITGPGSEWPQYSSGISRYSPLRLWRLHLPESGQPVGDYVHTSRLVSTETLLQSSKRTGVWMTSTQNNIARLLQTHIARIVCIPRSFGHNSLLCV